MCTNRGHSGGNRFDEKHFFVYERLGVWTLVFGLVITNWFKDESNVSTSTL